VVLVVLRGYPGYQCPFCNRQVQDFIQKSQGFADAGARVVLVYPGPAQDLGAKANEFLSDKKLPGNIELLLDPGYDFTNMYGLRWDAPHETAYPSTFLIDSRGVYSSARSSKSMAEEPRLRKLSTHCQNTSPGSKCFVTLHLPWRTVGRE